MDAARGNPAAYDASEEILQRLEQFRLVVSETRTGQGYAYVDASGPSVGRLEFGAETGKGLPFGDGQVVV